MPWPGIEPATLAHGEDTRTKWATRAYWVFNVHLFPWWLVKSSRFSSCLLAVWTCSCSFVFFKKLYRFTSQPCSLQSWISLCMESQGKAFSIRIASCPLLSPVPRGVTLIIHQVWVFLTPDLICELSVWGLRCSSNSLGCSWPSVCWPVTPPRAIPQAQTGQGTCLCHSARLRSTLPSHTWCQATVPAYTSKNVIVCLKINFLLPYLLKEAPCLLCMECHSYSLELQGDWRVLQIHSVPAGGCGSEPEACASLIE